MSSYRLFVATGLAACQAACATDSDCTGLEFFDARPPGNNCQLQRQEIARSTGFGGSASVSCYSIERCTWKPEPGSKRCSVVCNGSKRALEGLAGSLLLATASIRLRCWLTRALSLASSRAPNVFVFAPLQVTQTAAGSAPMGASCAASNLQLLVTRRRLITGLRISEATGPATFTPALHGARQTQSAKRLCIARRMPLVTSTTCA